MDSITRNQGVPNTEKNTRESNLSKMNNSRISARANNTIIKINLSEMMHSEPSKTRYNEGEDEDEEEEEDDQSANMEEGDIESEGNDGEEEEAEEAEEGVDGEEGEDEEDGVLEPRGTMVHSKQSNLPYGNLADESYSSSSGLVSIDNPGMEQLNGDLNENYEQNSSENAQEDDESPSEDGDGDDDDEGSQTRLRKRAFRELENNEIDDTPKKTPNRNSEIKIEESLEKRKENTQDSTNEKNLSGELPIMDSSATQKPATELGIVKVKGRKGRPPDALRRQQMLLQQQENPNFQLDSDKKMGFLKYKKFISKNSNVKEDYTEKKQTPEEVMKASLDSGIGYNNKLLRERITLKEQMKKIAKQNLGQRFALDGSNSLFSNHYVPLYLFDQEGGFYYDKNNSITVKKSTIENFIHLNVMNENNSGHDHSSKMGNFYARRLQRRRRRRRNTGKIPVEPPKQG